MAGKSDYKKIVHEWGRKKRKNFPTRKIEEQVFMDAALEKETKYKKKAKKDGRKRTDHKHDYEIVLVKRINNGENSDYSVERVCRICGRIDDSLWCKKWPFGDEYEATYKLEKKTSKGSLWSFLTEEEVMKKFSNLRLIERQKVQ